MSGRDANQLAADVRAGMARAETNDKARIALDELVGLVGTLQQERDTFKRGVNENAALVDEQRERAEAAEAALATTRQALTEIERIPYQSGRARGDVAIEIARRALAAATDTNGG